jgi:hypothetical protein
MAKRGRLETNSMIPRRFKWAPSANPALFPRGRTCPLRVSGTVNAPERARLQGGFVRLAGEEEGGSGPEVLGDELAVRAVHVVVERARGERQRVRLQDTSTPERYVPAPPNAPTLISCASLSTARPRRVSCRRMLQRSAPSLGSSFLTPPAKQGLRLLGPTRGLAYRGRSQREKKQRCNAPRSRCS